MNFVDKMVERFTKLNRRLKKWRRGVSVLAVIVVFATTYALVLPAITLDKETASTQAGMEIAAEQIELEETGTVYESEPEETDSGSESEPAESEDEEDSGSDSGSAAAEEEDPEEESAASNEEDVASPADNSEAEGSSEEEPSEESESDEQSGGGMTAEIAAEGATDLIAGETPLITEQTQLFYENRDENDEVDYIVYAEFGEAARLPVGVELRVKEITKERDPEAYEMYSRKALEEMKDRYDENTALSFARFYDISFVYNGAEVEPGGDVKVRIEYAKTVDIRQETSVDAIHFDKEDQEKVDVIRSEIDSEKKGKEESVKAVEFESDRFSVYGIVGTEVLTGDVITADGSTYTVTVRYTADARIPSGAELKVSEITEESEEYAQYAEEAARTIYGDDKSEDTASVLPYVRFFDISILDGESEIEPAAPVQVEIALEDGAIDETENGAAFSTVHFTENGAEKMTIDVADSVKFETDSFSVYGVAYTYTVDFYYEQAEYHLDGGNEMLLSALFAELGIERDAGDAVEVVFSSPELVKVEQTDGDWNLVSLQPFMTAETLTITFADGEVIVIYVTDEIQGWTDFGTNCQWMITDAGELQIRARAANAVLQSFDSAADWPWNSYRNQIKSVKFVKNGSYGKVKAAANMGYMLANCPILESVDFSYLDTSTCTGKMRYLFSGDSNLTSINWGDFNTSCVTDMSYMFNNCSSLATLDVSCFDVQNVKNMNFMFSGCKKIEDLDCSDFVTSNLQVCQQIFGNMTSLKKLNIEKFTLQKVTGAAQMFSGSMKIEEFKLGAGYHWNMAIIDKSSDSTNNTASSQPPRGTWIFEPSDGSGSEILTDIQIYDRTKKSESTGKVAGTYKIYSRDTVYIDTPTTYVIAYGNDWGVKDATANYKLDEGMLWVKLPTEEIPQYPSTKTSDVTINKSDGNEHGKDITIPGSITVIYKDAVTEVESGKKYDMKLVFSNITLKDALFVKDLEIPNDAWLPFYVIQSKNLQLYSEKISGVSKYAFYHVATELINIEQIVVDQENESPVEGTYVFGFNDLDIPRYTKVDVSNNINKTNREWGANFYSEGVILNDGYDVNTITSVPGNGLEQSGVKPTNIFGTHLDNNTSFEEFLVIVQASGFKYTCVQPSASGNGLEPGGQRRPITLKKVDEWDTERPVVGASLSTCDIDTQPYGDGKLKLDIIDNTRRDWVTTTEKPDETFYPVAGKYYLYEEKEPVPAGYNLADPILFYVDASFKIHVIKDYDSTTVPGSYIISDTAYLTPPDEDGQNGIVRMLDPRIKGELKIKKQVTYNNEEPETAEQKSKLAGTYVFTIYTDEECTVPYQKTEGEDVTISITIEEDGAAVTSEAVELAPGRYWVKENEPENDARPLQEVLEFNIVGGETAESAVIKTFTNNINTVDIHVLKVDDSTPGKPLTGASFKLTQVDESGHAVPGGIKQGPKDVDENGKLDFEGLLIGFYELEETKTPVGYVKTSDNPRFEVKADSETGELGIVFTDTDTVKYASDTKTFTVINKPGAQLPATGGPGTLLYILGGLALMLGAALMYGFSMRHRERRSN